MKNMLRVLQVAFTYTGTVVGAGFATGQEILQFFTAYGWWAPLTIGLATMLFVWLGTKLMVLSHHIQAKSYEDVNKVLFGERVGASISLFTMVVIICVNSVMLAGAGSVFVEHLNMNYQTGLLLTLSASFLIISRGMNAIIKLNSLVVPTMLVFTTLIMIHTLQMPNVGQLLTISTDKPFYAAWTAPFLYGAFNLAMAQAVLVPLGATMPSKNVIRMGGIIGGIFIGLMLLTGHFALSAQMPGITQFDIPMGQIASGLGITAQLIYVLLIFSEIFTTLVSDVYGVTLQLHQRTGTNKNVIIFCIMLFCYIVSQFGFRSLMSFLYPLFGMFSLVWLYLLMRTANPPRPHANNKPDSIGTSIAITPLQPKPSQMGRKKA
ncbi:YkvI family membrane protein [Paenibacillus apiarius]|uniref:Membrane protein YkvI n=1 Tax=Paenibacillus apiarius TaxID=46240 RepID=A0ABT4E028_9BACL|nr:hypothetical protein [Paenibacillus apiarius]MBN3522754.1 hypothetical protein [Paenibacillus apiarius]MCY9515050.1 hypothetical protein [Paenibacillus apiarius]MCY9522964.1 hypothetical protein [Paenibacillus apiarius]MCY9553767.1 hypothetical protein [Paenibacillus apiarius]MCY9556400.1 hypothetical protein [Paenibacillus apiarius]